MPSFSIPLGPDGAFINMGVSVPHYYARHGGQPGTWRALIDTGADVTTISPHIVAAISPQQIGVLPVTRPGAGSVAHKSYDIQIRFGGHNEQGRWFALEAPVIRPATANVDILVGMDLLLQINMLWVGQGPYRPSAILDI